MDSNMEKENLFFLKILQMSSEENGKMEQCLKSKIDLGLNNKIFPDYII